MNTTKPTIKSIIIKAAAAALFLLIIMAFAGCSPEQVAAWKAASQQAAEVANEIGDEIAALEFEYANLNLSDPVEQDRAQRIAASLGALRDKWDEKAAIVVATNEKIQNAEDAFGIAEVIMGAVGVFIPGLGIAVPLIRRWKAAFETVVVAIGEGGGPKDPAKTAQSMGAPTSRVRTMVRAVNRASGLKAV